MSSPNFDGNAGVSPAGRPIETMAGDPTTVEERGAQMEEFGQLMTDAAQVLEDIKSHELSAGEAKGMAVEALRASIGDSSDTLRRAGELYRPVGQAFRQYGSNGGNLKPRLDSHATECEELWQAYLSLPGDKDGAQTPTADDGFLGTGIGGHDASSPEAEQEAADNRAKKEAYDAWHDVARRWDVEYDGWDDAYQTAVAGINDGMVGGIEDTVFDLVGRWAFSGSDNADDEYEYDETGTLPDDVKAAWQELSVEEQKKFIETALAEICEDRGIDVPEIDWDELPEDNGDGSVTHGSWDDNDNDFNPFDGAEMNLNKHNLDDPEQTLNTLAHEAQHGFQHAAEEAEGDLIHFPWDDPFDDFEDKVSEDQAEEWGDNFDDYKTREDDGWDAYKNQPVEVDARKAGYEYVEDLDMDDYERILEDSQ